MKKIMCLIMIMLCFPSVAMAQRELIKFTEPNGTTYWGTEIRVPNNGLTNLGNRKIQLNLGAVNLGGTGQTTYTNGQLLIGNTTGNTLSKSTLTGTTNQITVTNGAGTITLSTPQSIDPNANAEFQNLQIDGNITLTGNFGLGSGINSDDDGILTLNAGNGCKLRKDYINLTANIIADSNVNIQTNIPANSKIIAIAIQVESALAGGETWNADFIDADGVHEAICTTQAVALNTEYDEMVDYGVDPIPILDKETDVLISPSVGGVFTAQGSIRVVVWFETLVGIDDI